MTQYLGGVNHVQKQVVPCIVDRFGDDEAMDMDYAKNVFQYLPAVRLRPEGGPRLPRDGAGTRGRRSPGDERPRGFAAHRF